MARSASPSLLGALALAACLALAGCIKSNDAVAVKADGSGSFTSTIVIDMKAMKGIADAMGGAFGKEPGAPEEKPEDPLEKLKEEWKHIEGLEIVKATSEEKDGKVTMSVEAKFKTLEAYARATSMEMNGKLEKKDDGSYVLSFADDKDDKKEGEGAEGGEAGADMGAAMAAAMMPMLEGFMKGLEMTRKLTLPGKIVETNGTKSEDGSTVTWTVKWDDIKKTQKTPKQTVTFRGDNLSLKPFAVTREKGGGGPPPGGDDE